MNTLIPFQSDSTTSLFKIQASFLQKSPFEVHLEFHLTGDIARVLMPPPTEAERTDELWKTTCLEAFVEKSSGGYLEINCSPSGHWSAYEFDSYRQNMRPAAHITVRLTRLEKDDSKARFFIQVISEKELNLLRAGLTMVLETTKHEKSYWALHHPALQADFHHQDGWTLKI